MTGFLKAHSSRVWGWFSRKFFPGRQCCGQSVPKIVEENTQNQQSQQRHHICQIASLWKSLIISHDTFGVLRGNEKAEVKDEFVMSSRLYNRITTMPSYGKAKTCCTRLTCSSAADHNIRLLCNFMKRRAATWIWKVRLASLIESSFAYFPGQLQVDNPGWADTEPEVLLITLVTAECDGQYRILHSDPKTIVLFTRKAIQECMCGIESESWDYCRSEG